MLFIVSLNFTDRGIREIKDDLKRAQAAQDLAKKCGCEIKQIFLTSGCRPSALIGQNGLIA